MADRDARGPSRIPRGPAVLAAQATLIAAFLALWALLSSLQVGGPDALSHPVAVAGALATALSTAEGWAPVVQTLASWSQGLAISIVVGVSVGALLGLSRFTYRSTRGLFDFARAVPPVALLPMGVFLIGTNRDLTVTMIIWTCMWPIVLQTMYGVRDVDHVAREAARTMRLSGVQTALWLIGPSALPYIMTGIRISAVMSLVMAIGTELIVGLPGIGYALYYAQYSGAITQMYAYVVVAALVGAAITFVFTRLERRALRWHPSHRKAAA